MGEVSIIGTNKILPSQNCTFGNSERARTFGTRKVRTVRNESGDLVYYLPIRREEVEGLGSKENSKEKCEIARIDDYPGEQTVSELQAELKRIKIGLRKVLDEYDSDTSIRKSSLLPKIQRLIGNVRLQEREIEPMKALEPLVSQRIRDQSPTFS